MDNSLKKLIENGIEVLVQMEELKADLSLLAEQAGNEHDLSVADFKKHVSMGYEKIYSPQRYEAKKETIEKVYDNLESL